MKRRLNDPRLKKIVIMVDRDENLYEDHHFLVKIMRLLVIPFLNILPGKLSRAIFLALSGQEGDPKLVFSSRGTYKALEVMYTFPARKKAGKTTVVDYFWEYFLSNARAFRNRLALVEKELKKAIQEVNERKHMINLFSLGAGSARAVFEAIDQLNHQYSIINHQYSIRIKLIDASREAIEYSKKLSLSYNIDQGKIEWHRDYAQKLERYCQAFQPDIVEMVGLLDYYPDEMAINLIAKICKVLSPGGWLITSNVCPNLERLFCDKGIDWQAIYRTPEELAQIILKGGFRAEGIKILLEPLKIHAIAICQKLV